MNKQTKDEEKDNTLVQRDKKIIVNYFSHSTYIRTSSGARLKRDGNAPQKNKNSRLGVDSPLGF